MNFYVDRTAVTHAWDLIECTVPAMYRWVLSDVKVKDYIRVGFANLRMVKCHRNWSISINLI